MTLSDLERSSRGHTSFQWPISPNLFKITTELLVVMDRKSYMRFHLAPLSLTLSDIERSIQVTQIEVRHILEGRNMEPLADTAKFIFNDG